MITSGWYDTAGREEGTKWKEGALLLCSSCCQNVFQECITFIRMKKILT